MMTSNFLSAGDIIRKRRGCQRIYFTDLLHFIRDEFGISSPRDEPITGFFEFNLHPSFYLWRIPVTNPPTLSAFPDGMFGGLKVIS
jgi:hypothetical protein